MKRNIQEEMKELWGNSCYAWCLVWLYSENTELTNMMKDIIKGIEKKYIDYPDCYVREPAKFVNMLLGFPRFRDVEKVYSEPPKSVTTIVEWVNGEQSHFVVMQEGKVIFDPSGDSKTVRNGKISSWRRFF
jgi:hypothetical protein